MRVLRSTLGEHLDTSQQRPSVAWTSSATSRPAMSHGLLLDHANFLTLGQSGRTPSKQRHPDRLPLTRLRGNRLEEELVVAAEAREHRLEDPPAAEPAPRRS